MNVWNFHNFIRLFFKSFISSSFIYLSFLNLWICGYFLTFDFKTFNIRLFFNSIISSSFIYLSFLNLWICGYFLTFYFKTFDIRFFFKSIILLLTTKTLIYLPQKTHKKSKRHNNFLPRIYFVISTFGLGSLIPANFSSLLSLCLLSICLF